MVDNIVYKAVAFDLDGTLLNKGKLSPVVRDAVKALKDSGIITIVATGRDWCQISEELRGLFSYSISTSGACIRDCQTGDILFSNPIPKEDVLKVIQVIDEFKAGYFLYLEGSAECTGNAFALINKFIPRVDRENYLTTFNTREHAKHSLYDFEKETEKTVFKIESYFSSREKSIKAKEELEKVANLDLVVMNHDSLEINAGGVSKARALKRLGSLAGFSEKELVAIGDSMNDYDMLQLAGLPVVMDNGQDEVKKIAKLIAPDVNEDGVAKVISELFNI